MSVIRLEDSPRYRLDRTLTKLAKALEIDLTPIQRKIWLALLIAEREDRGTLDLACKQLKREDVE